MAFVNSGTQRTLNLTIKKTGNDGSSIDQYLVLDGKDAFGSYAQITQDEMQKLSDVDFTARVNAWKSHLQSTYSISDPNMWDDISASFTYVNGIVVRLYRVDADNVKTTIYGAGSHSYPVWTQVVDAQGNTICGFNIYPGSTQSDSWQNSQLGQFLTDVKNENRFILTSPEFSGGKHVAVYVQTEDDTSYPIPE